MESLEAIKPTVQREHESLLTAMSQRSRVPESPGRAEQLQAQERGSQIDRAATEKVVERIQQYVTSMAVKLNFEVHDETGVVMVRVIKQETGEVIREIPPMQILDLSARIDEMIGALFDART